MFKNDPEREAALNNAIDAEIESFHATYGKQPDATQIQSMVDRMLLDAERWDPGLFDNDTTVKLYELKPGDFLAEPLVSSETEIPLKNRESARINAKTLFGRDLKESELLYLYSAALAYKRGAFIEAPDSLKLKLIEKGYPADTVNTVFAKAGQMILGIK
jgi:hypothetical protein